MGLANAGQIASRLMQAGRSPETPALIVENASLGTERRITAPLKNLATATAGLSGPALLMLGEAMALAQAGGACAEAPLAAVVGGVG